MKVLLSAYACEPDKGSEPGVGWHWAIETARLGHEVHVLTRANNAGALNQAANLLKMTGLNLHFHFCDLPSSLIYFLKRAPGAPYVYYYLWQLLAASLAMKLHKRIAFELVHHITFGSVRLPSFMGRLKIPFVVGPLGGGESAPLSLRVHYPIRGKIIDWFRDVSSMFTLLDPLTGKMFGAATVILLKTDDSIRCIPRRYRHKCSQALEIGIESRAAKLPRQTRPLTSVLFVGRHVYWKGMGLGLRAFALAQRQEPSLSLTMVGDGPEADTWKRLAERLGIASSVHWLGWLPQSEVHKAYADHHLLLFPSLHDSSGNVILEAVSHGLTVACLSLGGPGSLVDGRVGIKVDVSGMTESECCDALAAAILEAVRSSNRGLREEWLSERTWIEAVKRVYENPLSTLASSNT